MRIVPILIIAAATGCGSSTGQEPAVTVRPGAPGAPGEATRQAESTAADRHAATHTAADVAFVRAMIPHHAQALVMSELVPDRTDRRDIRLAAERIAISQTSEIARMRRWLRERGEPQPTTAHSDGEGRAHGMAAPEELARLAAARGPEFDRLFLELMIRHHQGALAMVRQLLSVPGAAQEAELFQLVSHIGSDQRAEIARMRRMLNASTP